VKCVVTPEFFGVRGSHAHLPFAVVWCEEQRPTWLFDNLAVGTGTLAHLSIIALDFYSWQRCDGSLKESRFQLFQEEEEEEVRVGFYI
jgi:hypothetical protein